MMTNQEITNGLKQLGFNSGWVVTGDEITLWENTETQPTAKAIADAAKLWEQNELAAKQSATGKLAALGLTPEDLKALGL
jgi:hypothetical protein